MLMHTITHNGEGLGTSGTILIQLMTGMIQARTMYVNVSLQLSEVVKEVELLHVYGITLGATIIPHRLLSHTHKLSQLMIIYFMV